MTFDDVILIITTIVNVGLAIFSVRLAIESYKEYKESERKLKDVKQLEELVSKLHKDLGK